MAKNLLIVESPAKGKTIKKYLGKDFDVLASYGHVRDLVPKEGAVDPDNHFSMKYQPVERNKKHVDAIKKLLKKADSLLLATDPDREGEAISWHLLELLKEKNLLKDKKVARVVFHEVTKKSVNEAVQNPKELDMNQVNAQQARRALDYLVGFNLSPLLWKKIKYGLSAGRVQSPALRLIVEREEEIQAFEPQEYWTIQAATEKQQKSFLANLTLLDNEKVKKFTVNNEQQALAIKDALLKAANGELHVGEITRKQRKRNPAPPFTTSTLQQEAVRKLGFSAQRTMRTAQSLYEGIAIAEGEVGLITYMRTDSVNLSQDALNEIREYIPQRFGQDMLPEKTRYYKTKSKNAQEAHEAIRPTSIKRHPEEVKAYLSPDQYKLYSLIWKRTLACQMIHATIDTVSANLLCGSKAVFRASGSTIKHPGFISVYQEGQDDVQDQDDENMLPALKEGETLPLKDIISEQHFTEPPPRYNEATLVKTLEEYGIGRPSTYASIISTLQDREYATLEQRRFYPTDIGKIVTGFLSKFFTRYVDYDFTAKLEDELDAIARGETQMEPVLDDFWHPFHQLVEDVEENVSRDEVLQSRELGIDPKSGKPVSVRMGRYGPYVQIGTRDDEEKPRFAGLRPGQKMDEITLQDALVLFQLPRELGESPEGEKISVNIGRFGPYVKYNSKYASIKEDDPYTITLERALEIVAEKKQIEANRIIQVFEEEGIQVLNGRYGPYITDGKKNAKIPKDKEPKELTLEECQQLIAAAPEKKTRGKKKTAGKKKATTKKKAAGKKKTKSKKKSTSKKKTATKKKTTSKK